MPRATLRSLADQLEAQRLESVRLREANERLQSLVSLQAERLRASSAAGPVSVERDLEMRSHCPVCYEALTDMDTALSCGHEFCQRCCQRHFSASTACPMCRKEASSKELWRFRHPRLSRYWHLLKASDWPKPGEFVLITTKKDALVGILVETSEDRASMSICYGCSAWELKLEMIEEIFTMQSLASSLPPREDGFLRVLSNA